MGIIHIVMFEFKEEVTAEEITDVCSRMLALKDKCLHPTTNTPYVKTAMGGKENSPEGIAVSFNSPALASLVPASPLPNFLIEPFLVDPPFAEPLLPLLTVQVIFPEHDLSWLTVYTLRDREVNA